MSFAEKALSTTRPESVGDLPCRPQRQSYFPSPVDWRDQVLYFLLVDRFSDGREQQDQRPLLDRHRLWAARPASAEHRQWRWDKWAESGAKRWQGGTIAGVKYWIALTDCDGFRIDTLKHVSAEQARNFCGAIKEFAANLNKQNFFLVGEISGGVYAQDHYLDSLNRNLSAVLDIGQMCPILSSVAKGQRSPRDYFNGFTPGRTAMGSHRNLGGRHVSILDDHDHIYSEKIAWSRILE